MKDEMQHASMREDAPGQVWLVGAGPGDPDLISARGLELIRQADAILYDHLISGELLTMAKPEARLVCVGKRAGGHSMSQDEISALLEATALECRMVVRLKGGDPYVFGRGGEEAMYLRQRGIPCSVVPGITSAVAALSSAGIPVTYRGLASSFHVITASAGDGSDIRNLKELASLSGTLVFLMAHGAVDRICRGLMEHGMDPATPVAAVSRGTFATERQARATLATAARAVKDASLDTPLILAIGDTADLDLRDRLSPLAGCSVAVTGSERITRKISGLLKNAGARVLALPDMIIRPKCLDRKIIDKILRHEWLTFTSPAGVKAFFDALRKARLDARRLAGHRCAVVGAATGQDLEEKGIFADLMPQRYSVEALARQLVQATTPKADPAEARDDDKSNDGNGNCDGGVEARTSGLERSEISKNSIALIRSSAGAESIARILVQEGRDFADFHIYDALNPEDGVASQDGAEASINDAEAGGCRRENRNDGESGSESERGSRTPKESSASKDPRPGLMENLEAGGASPENEPCGILAQNFSALRQIADPKSPNYRPEVDYLVFASGAGARNFIDAYRFVTVRYALAAIGEATAGEIRKLWPETLAEDASKAKNEKTARLDQTAQAGVQDARGAGWATGANSEGIADCANGENNANAPTHAGGLNLPRGAGASDQNIRRRMPRLITAATADAEGILRRLIDDFKETRK